MHALEQFKVLHRIKTNKNRLHFNNNKIYRDTLMVKTSTEQGVKFEKSEKKRISYNFGSWSPGMCFAKVQRAEEIYGQNTSLP